LARNKFPDNAELPSFPTDPFQFRVDSIKKRGGIVYFYMFILMLNKSMDPLAVLTQQIFKGQFLQQS